MGWWGVGSGEWGVGDGDTGEGGYVYGRREVGGRGGVMASLGS